VAHELEHEFDPDFDRRDPLHYEAQQPCVLNNIVPWNSATSHLIHANMTETEMNDLDWFYSNTMCSIKWPISHGHNACDYDSLVAYYRTVHP
jgi:hypothetical protein